jgi:glycosyltransferase involved in cell wall biosynthesis
MPVRNAKGGITQYALRNWEYIDKSRFLFDWVTLDKELSFEPELVRQGCNVHYLSCRQEEDESRFRVEMEAILECGYDAVHLHTSYWRGFLAEELAIDANVPRIIVHAHSTGIDVSDVLERTRLLDAHNAWKARFNEALATHFTACSSPAAEFLFGAQIPMERVVILKNAIDTGKFAYNAKTRAETRSRMGLDGEFVILQPARMVYQKNHSFMLGVFAEASRQLPNAVLLLAGDGDLRDALVKEAGDLRIANRVRFLGFRDDIQELLQAADLLVMPSLFEGLTIAAIEAQCSGVYCLLSDQMAEETVVSGNAVRLPLDTALWRDAIVLLAREGYERRDRSSEVAAAGYSMKEQVKVLERIYAGED